MERSLTRPADEGSRPDPHRWATSPGWAVVAALLLVHCGGDPPPRNVVLVTVGALSVDLLPCYGDREAPLAAPCALAEPGGRYVWAFAASAVPASAVASLLTSRYPGAHGVGANPATFLASGHETIAEVLQRGGYRTAAWVTSGALNRSRHLAQGFDLRRERADTAATVLPEVHAWVTTTPGPWFVWVHLNDLEVAGRACPEAGVCDAWRAAAAQLEAPLGRFLSQLETLESAPSVLLTADRARATRESDLSALRIPLLWRPLGGEWQGRVSAPVSALDVAPTLARIARHRAPAAFEGERLPEAGTRPSPTQSTRPLYAESGRRVAVVAGSFYHARGRGPEHAAEPREFAQLEPDGAWPPIRRRASEAEATRARRLLEGFAVEAEGEVP